MNKLCEALGQDVRASDGETYFDYPKVEALATANEVCTFTSFLLACLLQDTLRRLGFGYRAGYLVKAAQHVQRLGGRSYLESLRAVNNSYEKAKSELMAMPGVGSKVADCVLLMSLDHHQVVPVDTHVYQITRKHYLPSLKDAKSLTPTLHKQIGDFYVERFGAFAGWAHSVLCVPTVKIVLQENVGVWRAQHMYFTVRIGTIHIGDQAAQSGDSADASEAQDKYA